jgi:hypothetical protein
VSGDGSPDTLLVRKSGKARDIKVIISPANRRLLDFLEKRDMKVPGFSILG